MVNEIWNFALLILGFVFLIKGADMLIDGSASIAKRYKISNLVIGLTIVAFGTSTPELIINVLSSLGRYPDIAVGNILGSNISNTLLILGVAAVIYPLSVRKDTISEQIPFSVFAALVVWFVANDAISGTYVSWISRSDALVLIVLFAVFLYYSFGVEHIKGDVEEQINEVPPARSIVFIVLGIIGLALGGRWVVNSAVSIADSFGISQKVIGLTLVALGTSLPELVTSIVAAMKKQTDIILGNVVGSNIFNLLWILGVTALISPIRFEQKYNSDLAMMVFASILLLVFLFIGKKKVIGRIEGLIFVMIYTAYVTVLLLG